MCGIIYAHELDGTDVSQSVILQYRAQESRGKEGFGFYLPDTDRLFLNRKERPTLKALRNARPSEVIFHHRLPTSTPNVQQSAHPFSTGNYFGDNQYILVHNGSITNAEERHKAHKAMGITYRSEHENGTFNDSEALLWDMALYLEGLEPNLQAEGNIAFILLERHKGKNSKLHLGRNYSKPLKLDLTKTGIYAASEGTGREVAPNTLLTYDYDNNTVAEKPFYILSGVVKYFPYSTKNNYADDEDEHRKNVQDLFGTNVDYTVGGDDYFNDESPLKYYNPLSQTFQTRDEIRKMLSDHMPAMYNSYAFVYGDVSKYAQDLLRVNNYKTAPTIQNLEKRRESLEDYLKLYEKHYPKYGQNVMEQIKLNINYLDKAIGEILEVNHEKVSK